MTRALALLLALLPSAAAAQTPTPPPEPPYRAEFLSTIGTLTKADANKTPIVGVRVSVDVRTVADVHLVLRADLSRMSDGGAADQAAGVVPSFESGEVYAAIYRRIAGPVALEAVVGRAFALDPDQTLIESSPDIVGGGLRLELRGGYAFIGLGRHGAAGAGARVLVSILLPAKGNTSLLVDGAIAEDGKSVVRSGVAVRF